MAAERGVITEREREREREGEGEREIAKVDISGNPGERYSLHIARLFIS
jgi:hypothetical protein